MTYKWVEFWEEMKLERTYVLKVPISITTENEIINTIKEKIENNQKFSIVAININKIMLYQKNEEIAKVIKSFDCFIPDGISVVKACPELKIRITGVDLLQKICEKHKAIGVRIFLYGAKQDVVTKMKQKLEEKYNGIQIVGIENGYVQEDGELIQKVNQSKANIIFVAKGSPKQEEWIYKNKDKLNVNIFMGVGGAFDIVSGNIKRAPVWIRNLGMEWLYRILREPQKRLKQIPVMMKYWHLIRREKNRQTE